VTASKIDPERLAALLDGRLDAAARAEVLSQLESSPEALEAYADAVAIRRELEGDAAGATEAPPAVQLHKWRRLGPGTWFAIAAGLLVAIAWPVFRVMETTRATSSSPLIVAGYETAGSRWPDAWDGTPWAETRGPSDQLSPTARAVRIGARLTDYGVLVRAGDSTAAAVAFDVAALLDPIPAGSAVASQFRDFAARQVTGVTAAELSRAAGDAEQLAGNQEARVGGWLEGARLAAAQRDEQFFDPARLRTAAAVLSAMANRHPAARPSLDGLVRLLAASPRDWPAVQGAATDALRALAE